MKNELNIEESARLIELGVDAKLASKKEFVDIHPEVLKGNAEYARPWGWIPRFTLSDILSILPKEIYGRNLGMEYDSEFKQWCSGYNGLRLEFALELIDSLNQLLIWAITNGHLKTEKR